MNFKIIIFLFSQSLLSGIAQGQSLVKSLETGRYTTSGVVRADKMPKDALYKEAI
jgi:hypothetical protein